MAKKPPIHQIPGKPWVPWIPPSDIPKQHAEKDFVDIPEKPGDIIHPGDPGRSELVTVRGRTVFMTPTEKQEFMNKPSNATDIARTQAGEEQGAAERLARNMQLIQEKIKAGEMTAEEGETGYGAILKGAAPDVISKAVGGAIGGALLKGGGAAAGGAALGGAAAGIYSLVSEMKEEEKENVGADFLAFKKSRQRIGAIIDGVNQGTINPRDAIVYYNRELAKIDAIERTLKKRKDWLANTKNALIWIEDFNTYERATTNIELSRALAAPNPMSPAFLTSDIGELPV